MFQKTPTFYGHKSLLNKGNYVLHDVILNEGESDVNLFRRFCPHRMYPLHQPGDIVQDIHCEFHNFKWDKTGIPINNNKKLNCGTAKIGKSGLIMNDFSEPDQPWVDELAKETELQYSHSYKGTSKGSWLWYMEVNVDLLHVYEGGIHPFLSKQVKLEDVTTEQGDDWSLQHHPDGWWCCIYPFTFLEYGRPGKLSINIVTPHDMNSEFGFDWITQVYYNNDVPANDRLIFETLQPVFDEDLAAAEKQKGGYFPLMEATNEWENLCVHFGNWYRNNVNKK
jgi:phenylpropionate dioxygenase-like ring-hydroxylating dioxygenase large terminal subunit